MAIDDQRRAEKTAAEIRLGTSRQVLLIVLVALGWASDNFDRKVLPVALPYIGQDFHVNSAELGALSSIFFAFYAISQVPGGALADRFGSKRLMVGAMFAWSVFTGLMGAGSVFWMLLAFQAAFGVGQGAWPGASMKFVSGVTPPRFRMTTYGAIQFTTAMGSAVAPLAAAVAIAALGWRAMFAVFMLIGLLLGLLMWWLVPRDNRLVPDNREAAAARPGQFRASLRTVLRSATLWKFAIMFVGIDLIINGTTAWVPSFLIKSEHVPLVHAGLLASIPGYVSAVSMFTGGILFDRYFHSRQRWLIIPCMLVSGVFIIAMASTRNVTWFIVFDCLAMFVAYLTFLTVAGIPMRYCAPEIRGAATAFVNVGGAVGGFIAPIVTGALIDAYSYKVAFLFLAVGALITAAASSISPQQSSALQRKLGNLSDLTPGIPSR